MGDCNVENVNFCISLLLDSAPFVLAIVVQIAHDEATKH